MEDVIKKIGFIGTGTMGLGIASQVVNAGLEVIFLDVASGEGSRNELSQKALNKMITGGAQGPLMDVDFAKRITIGNIEDNLDLLADCDWIVEAVIEQADIKRALYLKINEIRKASAYLTSNTSTIPLAHLMKDMPESLQSAFLITHFFNPPRHMRLLEVVRSGKMPIQRFDAINAFAEKTLGKNVVICHDRPGFIANRLGVYWIECALREAIALGLTIDQADSLMSSVLEAPKTGVFGLIDLIGVDLLPDITDSLTATLEENDPLQEFKATPKVISIMIEKGLLGRKSGGGFYRLSKTTDGAREKHSLDLKTINYSSSQKTDHPYLRADPTQLAHIICEDNIHARYLRRVIIKTLNYASYLISDAADTPMAIDEAMRLGYNWKYGPFELIDLIGAKKLASNSTDLVQDTKLSPFLSALNNRKVYSSSNGTLLYFDKNQGHLPRKIDKSKLSLSFIKQTTDPAFTTDSGNLWPLGDGVACLEITTKLNVISSGVLNLIERTLSIVEKDFSALVIFNEGQAFAAGANLVEIQALIKKQDFAAIADFIQRGQSVFMKLKNAPFPVVGAPTGLALGGGCELLFHCHAIVAHCELYMGLVEFKVGAIPAWGGTQELLLRVNESNNPELTSQKAFELIAKSVVSKSAYEAQKLGYLRCSDQIVMNKDHMLMEAKQKALSMIENTAPLPFLKKKKSSSISIDITNLSDHDQLIIRQLEGVFNSVVNASEKERDAFVKLMRTSATQARIKHMLSTGKALSN